MKHYVFASVIRFDILITKPTTNPPQPFWLRRRHVDTPLCYLSIIFYVVILVQLLRGQAHDADASSYILNPYFTFSPLCIVYPSAVLALRRFCLSLSSSLIFAVVFSPPLSLSLSLSLSFSCSGPSLACPAYVLVFTTTSIRPLP